MSNVAFLGLGAMGFPMAGHLARRFPTAVWNRTRAVAERHAAEHGTRVAADVADAVRNTDIVFSCVPTSREVDELVAAAGDALQPGSVWVDCTSGDPAVSRCTAATLAGRGVAFLDAPVSGGRPGAEAGTLTVMAGGDENALARVRPALESFASTIVRVGEVGSGHAVKAVNNAMMAVNMWAAAEGLLTLRRHGVPLATALQVINSSSGRSFASESLLPGPMTSGEYPLWFKLALLQKDCRIASSVARGAGQPAPVISQIADLLGMARATLGDTPDYREIARALDAWAHEATP
jgi:3-hydroxyisobutyrate dehydrogenase